MKPAPFAYERPDSLEAAVRLLDFGDGDARVLAGGQSLVPLLNFRLARPRTLVDLARVPGLSYVREEAGELAIGAMTRQSEIEDSPLIVARHPMLANAVRHVAHSAIRHRGTVGGSIAHADPAAELACVLVACGGAVIARGRQGQRRVDAAAFFQGFFQTALEPWELLTEVRFGIPESGWGFEEVSRRHGDFALAMAAATLRLDDVGRIAQVALVLGAAGPAPAHATIAEALLLGQTPTSELLARAATAAGQAVDATDDIHATAEDRRHLGSVVAARALEQARRGAQVAA